MRVLVLTLQFQTERRLHARPGSAEDAPMRRVLRQLADERIPAPAPDDEEALRTPFERIWARRVSGTNLVVTFVVSPAGVEVTGVRPSWNAH